MDFLIDKRITQFPDKEELESLRTLGEHIRQYNLGKLPEILVQLETRLTENGVHVHWAETPDEANAIILGICQKHSAKLMVKGKSMVSEEIELNHACEAAGIEAMESDMGEYIVQLAGEKPSHIIMPAIHKTKEEIVASIKRGLYATNFGGGQVDITSGKFVFSASEAFWVENGKIQYPVKGATIIGNGPDALTRVSAIGNDMKLDTGVGVCGKDGQSVPVGVGQPTLRIDRLTVGGTA